MTLWTVAKSCGQREPVMISLRLASWNSCAFLQKGYIMSRKYDWDEIDDEYNVPELQWLEDLIEAIILGAQVTKEIFASIVRWF